MGISGLEAEGQKEQCQCLGHKFSYPVIYWEKHKAKLIYCNVQLDVFNTCQK